MIIPTAFERRLSRLFDGRYRIRWSNKRHEFHVEQKVAPGQVLAPPPIAPGHYDTESDEWIRARDGYVFVMALRNGDRMPCPVCGLTLRVPIMRTGEALCGFCRSRGRDGRYPAAYYPEWNDRLLDHLRAIDPYSSDTRQAYRALRRRQLEKFARERQAALDDAEYRVIFNKNQVEDNPMVGYGPKTVQHTAQRFYAAAQEND